MHRTCFGQGESNKSQLIVVCGDFHLPAANKDWNAPALARVSARCICAKGTRPTSSSSLSTPDIHTVQSSQRHYPWSATSNMSTILGRLAGRARHSALRTSFRNASGEAEVEARAATSDLKAKKQESKSILQKGAQRDPELYVGFSNKTKMD